MCSRKKVFETQQTIFWKLISGISNYPTKYNLEIIFWNSLTCIQAINFRKQLNHRKEEEVCVNKSIYVKLIKKERDVENKKERI